MSDLISRQAAILQLSHNRCGNDENDIAVEHDIETIRKLPSAQPEQRWIPCSEKLPDKTDDYLCTYTGCAEVDICSYDPDSNEWGFFYDGEWKVVSNVIAWMPLPEPYTERREE